MSRPYQYSDYREPRKVPPLGDFKTPAPDTPPVSDEHREQDFPLLQSLYAKRK